MAEQRQAQGASGQAQRNQQQQQMSEMQRRGGGSQGAMARQGQVAPSAFAMSPFSLLRRLTEEMGQLFEDFGAGRELQRGGAGAEAGPALWSPQVEMFERDGELVVRADLPGVNKGDVRVELTDDALIIEGEREQKQEENRAGFYRSERIYGHFYRQMPLPEGVDTEKARVTFNNGVLEISMPAPQQQQRSRQLEIEGGQSGGTQAQAQEGGQSSASARGQS
jgi:HSP20 family protein